MMRFVVFTVAMAIAVPATAREVLSGLATDFILDRDRSYCDTKFFDDYVASGAEGTEDTVDRLVLMDGSSKFISIFWEWGTIANETGNSEIEATSVEIKVMDCAISQSFIVAPSNFDLDDLFDEFNNMEDAFSLASWVSDALTVSDTLDWQPLDKISACVCDYLASGDFAKDRDFEEEN